jgi:hypothetical protein
MKPFSHRSTATLAMLVLSEQSPHRHPHLKPPPKSLRSIGRRSTSSTRRTQRSANIMRAPCILLSV